MRRFLPAIVLSAWGALALADYDAVSDRALDLSGRWLLNTALSEDPQRMLAERMEKERKRYEQWRRREESMRPPGVPRLPDAQGDDNAPSGASRPRPQRPWQKRRDENFRQMLGITKMLDIRQSGSEVQIISAVESRRFIAGTHTQVSMPEGQLADSQVGWDGEWFVIERKASRGPRVVEKLRVSRKTGQLEYTMAWSGDTELSGIKVRRIFDRTTAEVAPPDPDSGPVR